MDADRHRHLRQTRTRTAADDVEAAPVTVLAHCGNRGRGWATLLRQVGRTGRTLGNRFWGQPCIAPALARRPVPLRYTRRLRANHPASQSDRGCHQCSGSPRHTRMSSAVWPAV